MRRTRRRGGIARPSLKYGFMRELRQKMLPTSLPVSGPTAGRSIAVGKDALGVAADHTAEDDLCPGGSQGIEERPCAVGRIGHDGAGTSTWRMDSSH
jgi:hypothetical protein